MVELSTVRSFIISELEQVAEVNSLIITPVVKVHVILDNKLEGKETPELDDCISNIRLMLPEGSFDFIKVYEK